MAKKPLPSTETLRQLLRYEPETGKLFWRERSTEWFKTKDPRGAEWARRCWNARFADREAVKCISHDGYGVTAIFKQSYYAHRLIWKMETGVEPDEIDHVDGDRLNNRMNNLRNVPPIKNNRNHKLRSDNTSGFQGVRKLPHGSYQVRVSVGGKRTSRSFPTMEEAVAYKRSVERVLGYHPNHGRLSA